MEARPHPAINHEMHMTALDILASPVQLSPINLETKYEILNGLLDHAVTSSQYYDSDLDYEVYFSYYTEQCRNALHDGGRHVSVRTHRDVVNIAKQIKDGQTRAFIKDDLNSKLKTPRYGNDDEILDGSIDLALRLLFMSQFGSLQYGFTGRKQLLWSMNSLGEFLHTYLNTPQALGQESVKFERIFNARNLERVAGMEIEWTDNLVDHLRLVDGDKKVAIFHHASFLECQLTNPLFPDGFIEETIKTLGLLFPQSDKDTKKWFTKISSSKHLDSKVIRCGRLRAENRHIGNFHFWHDKLVILKQVFDEAEPSNISQWWCDRRKRVQWYTFWIAALVLALTIFFGLVQCIEGALQVYKAYHPT